MIDVRVIKVRQRSRLEVSVTIITPISKAWGLLLSAESISFSAHHAERFLAWNTVYQNLAFSESHTSPHTKKRKKSEYKRAVTNTNRRFVFPYATDCEFKMRMEGKRRGDVSL